MKGLIHYTQWLELTLFCVVFLKVNATTNSLEIQSFSLKSNDEQTLVTYDKERSKLMNSEIKTDKRK